MIDPRIFRSYDIRALYPESVNEEAAFLIGKAFSSIIKRRKNAKRVGLVIGRDGRTSSESISKELIKGIISQGVDVYNIGLTSTPLHSFAIANQGYDGGIMVTASHNPANYNGFKIIKEEALQVHGEEIQEIRKVIQENSFQDSKEKGEVIEIDVFPQYKEKLLDKFKDLSGLKIVADYGNGVGSVTGVEILDSLQIEAVHLFKEVDGSFPNHPPNPHNLDNFKSLQSTVTQERADLGVFFDGDGDRALLVDEKGDIVSSDFLTVVLAEKELKKEKGKVYYDLRSSKIVGERIREMGGEPIMLRVGNPFYKDRINKEGGVLGGELSGHIMFKDHFGIDDGLYATLKAMTIISEKKAKLSSLVEGLNVYYQTEEINLEVKDKKQALERLRSHFKDGESKEIEGVYISYPDWWFNLRESNTEDLIRLKIEAVREDLLKEKRKEILGIIESL